MAACPAERLKDPAGAAASYCSAGRTGRSGAELKVCPRLARPPDRTAPPAASVHAALQRPAVEPGSPEQLHKPE
ncbi:Calcium-Activated Potassium Channel Subunit Alpha-1 [Manis pentadactyla]|nr:Calcium-Activated Potassium Channel Subunit Alpha-1 [Manis pentadactyla]